MNNDRTADFRFNGAGLSDDRRLAQISEATSALRARMTRRFIDVDEAFAQLASELRWQTDQAAWGLRRARRMLQA